MTAPVQFLLDLGHRPALGQTDFLVAPCNEQAVAALDRWPDWPLGALVIHGPAGCGKTHLAHVWRARSHAMMARPEDLTRAEPPDFLKDSDAVVIENAETIATNDEQERALFHLYNLLAERKGFLLLTGLAAPSHWPLALPDLSSRLVAVPSVAVGMPDDALIAAVLVKLFADRQLKVGQEVIAYLVARMERSFEGARRVVGALDEAALASQRAITVPLVRDILHHNNA